MSRSFCWLAVASICWFPERVTDRLPAIRRALSAIFWAAILFTFVMAVMPHPPRLPGEPSDKVQHIIAFATLGLLGALAFPTRSIARLAIWLSLFGALIELVQAIPVLHRDSDILDWLADTLAVAAALLTARGFWRWTRGGSLPISRRNR